MANSMFSFLTATENKQIVPIMLTKAGSYSVR